MGFTYTKQHQKRMQWWNKVYRLLREKSQDPVTKSKIVGYHLFITVKEKRLLRCKNSLFTKQGEKLWGHGGEKENICKGRKQKMSRR